MKTNLGIRLKPTTFAVAMAFSGLTVGAANASELFFDYNKNTVGLGGDSSVFLFGSAGQSATVSNQAGFNQNVTLGADGFFNLVIPDIYQQSGTGIANSGFKIVSPTAIGGYFVNRKGFSTDMTYLLDSGALGTNYVVASQGNGFGEGSQVAIHATQNNTNVTFTPIGSAPITVTLQAGETYKYAGGATNLTGSQVVSDKAVAVFGGHECAQVPAGTTFCDTLLEQMIPTDKLSKTYYLAASQGSALASTTSDLVRVIATADNTEIKVGGVVVATKNKGEYHEFSLSSLTGTTVEASSAVMVAQYLKGGAGNNTDPAMSLVPGADTWLKSYRLSTPSGTQDFLVDYASIVIKQTDLGSLLLDGVLVDTSGCTAIAGTAYDRCDVTLPNGLFSLTADNPFLVMLGGGSNADSYFTYGGSTFAPGVSPPVDPRVPEPGMLSLLGVAMAGMGYARSRNQKRK